LDDGKTRRGEETKNRKTLDYEIEKLIGMIGNQEKKRKYKQLLKILYNFPLGIASGQAK